MAADAASTGSGSSDGGTRSVSLSVLRDSGSKVEVVIKAHGLKKKKSFFDSIITVFKKPSSPSRILANGQFKEFTLTAHGLSFQLEVLTDKKRKRKGNENRVDVFVCNLKQFPTSINPDSAQFEVVEPASGEAFIILTLIKTDGLNVNWKEFLSTNGTLDVTQI